MSKTPFPVFLLLAIALPSCDPAIGVRLVNQTQTEKYIRASYPEGFPISFDRWQRNQDSLKTYDEAMPDNYRHPVKIPALDLDTIAGTYAFHLKPGYSVLVESRAMTAYPAYGQVFIIDQRDTVILTEKGSPFVKRPKIMLGGEWTYVIKEKKK